eukprot:1590973-Pyramimonas_sp.AAC.1
MVFEVGGEALRRSCGLRAQLRHRPGGGRAGRALGPPLARDLGDPTDGQRRDGPQRPQTVVRRDCQQHDQRQHDYVTTN